MRDTANWDGIHLQSVNVGAREEGRKLLWRGYYYANESEFRLAQVLTRLNIPFTPDVKFNLKTDDGHDRVYVADFVFNTNAYVWKPRRGRPVLIHGFEAKAKSVHGFPERGVENERLLREQRGIVIPMLSDEDILRFSLKRDLDLTLF